MGVIKYDAKRNVIGGHTIGVEYSIETAFQQNDPSTAEVGTGRIPLGGGAGEYELDRIDELVALQSDIVTEANLLLWKEFLTSVQAREQFSVDLTGTIASPGTDLDCVIHRGGFNPRRSAAGLQLYLFSFTVRLI